MKIKDLLNSPGKWTKMALARDDHAAPISPLSPSAACWCLVGAVNHCYPIHNFSRESADFKARSNAILQLKKAITQHEPCLNDCMNYAELGTPPTSEISNYNDAETTTFADIQTILQLADV